MKKLLVVLVAALALLLPAGAAAKGPSEAQITGPGLLSPLKITGLGEGDSSTSLGLLVNDGGFFPQAFGQSPSPLLRTEPKNRGPRYLVTYTVPGPMLSALQQDLYPYASGGPVTYMQPGQAFWGDQRTVGGWYRGTPPLKTMLVKAGLPPSPPEHRHLVSILLAIVRHFLP
jgi:hypothetical protein